MTHNDGSEDADTAVDIGVGERRRHQRVAVNLPGRYMLEDGAEHPCQCIDVSVSGIRLRAAQAGPWGSRVIAYIDGIGRLEGYIVRRAPGWFALETLTSERKGERIRERIAAVLRSEAAFGGERRDNGRERTIRKISLYKLDGQKHEAILTDISRGGAALLTEATLEIDEHVRLESRRGRVLRLFPGGAALKFENWVDEAWLRRESLAPVPALPQTRVRRA